MATHPKVLGLTLDPKLTYTTHIHIFSVDTHKPLQIIKALTATGCGKQKESFMAIYTAVMRPALEYAYYIWLLLHPRPALTNYKSCRRQQDCHMMHTRHNHTPSFSNHAYTKCDTNSHPLLLCPPCNTHIFNCTQIRTTLVTPEVMDRLRRSDVTAGQMDGEAGWWTTSDKIRLPKLARVKGMGRQQLQRLLNNIFGEIHLPYLLIFKIPHLPLCWLNGCVL